MSYNIVSVEKNLKSLFTPTAAFFYEYVKVCINTVYSRVCLDVYCMYLYHIYLYMNKSMPPYQSNLFIFLLFFNFLLIFSPYCDCHDNIFL